MSGGLIRVTPEQLAAVAGQLNGGAGSIEATLGQLAGNVAPLGSDWAGVAQGRFLQLWEQWQTSSRQLHQALVEISALMNRASGAYEQNEQAVAASFGRQRVRVADGGGGRIEVHPEQLVALAGTVDAVAAGTDEAATGGAGAACFITGAGDVDAQLNRYTAGWAGQLHQLAQVTGQLADALVAAAADYVTTDTGVIGGRGSGGPAAGGGR